MLILSYTVDLSFFVRNRNRPVTMSFLAVTVTVTENIIFNYFFKPNINYEDV
jgi:hypothetical protein